MQLEVVSIFPSLLACGVAALTALAILDHSAFYADLVATQPARRYRAVDGLRGGLAFSVFLCHGVAFYYSHGMSRNYWPPSTFYSLCGSVPVALFFMITGLLFWDKAIAAAGRMDVRSYLASRLRRLAPMYLFCVLAVFIVVGFRTGWELHDRPLAVLRSVLDWLALGFFGEPDLNGLRNTGLINPALWTLRFECWFYLLLPALSLCATPKRFPILLVAGLATALAPRFGWIVIEFLIGMSVAQLSATRSLPRLLRSPAAAAASLVLLIASYFLGDGGYGLQPTLAAAPLFIVVAGGNDFLGLLSSRVMRFLGEISYSLYVLHCLLLNLAIALVSRDGPVTRLTPGHYWSLLISLTVALIVLAAVTYRWLEHPFMRRARTAPAPFLDKMQHQPI